MGFRRSDSLEPGTSRWRTLYRKELLRCGIPKSIVDSDRTLTYVLLHGADEFGSGWDPSWLSAAGARELLSVLEKAIPNAAAFDLVAVLRKRVQREGSHG
jgi:hypothetical protein